MTGRRERAVLVLIGIAGSVLVAWFVIGRAADFTTGAYPAPPRGVTFTSDSVLYMRDAHAPILSWALLASRQSHGGGGPFPYLLLLKLFGEHVAAVVIAQGVLWIAATWYLAASTLGLLATTAGRITAWAAVWAVAVSAPFMQWTAAILTESLSLTVGAVAIGAALQWVHRPDPLRTAVFALSIVVAALTRDTNALVALVAAGIVLLATAARRVPWRAGVAVAVIAVVGAGVALALSNHARRWYYPLEETTALRLQHDATAGPYLRAHGFPTSPDVQQLTSSYALAANNDDLDFAPRYADFRRWLDERGQRVYTRFLLTHPRWDLGTMWDARHDVLIPDIGRYASDEYVDLPRVSHWIAAVAFARSWWWFWTRLVLVAALVVAVSIVALGHRDTGSTRRWWRWLAILAALGFTGFVHAFAAFHGDSEEVARHEITAAFQLQLVVWLAVAAATDALVARRADAVIEAPAAAQVAA
jgi:hypothetical protein